MTDYESDVQAIRNIISRQFGALCWSRESSADWGAFLADFRPDAPLYPAARPVRRQSPAAFVERLAALAATELGSFHERVLGTQVSVFGNVAIAVAGCEVTENDTKTTRGVEMLLLVKDQGHWKIAAQGWDAESADKKLPPELEKGSR